jgi:tryptophan halogenase
MKCAIPFFLENDKDINPYTSAIALKNGWMWKTPLQDRIGAGYVFDSDYITPEEAQLEVEEFLGHDIKVNKVIPFDAGRFDNIWVNNCIGLGLSSNFIEPLESTSIHMTITLLDHLKHFINNMNSGEHDLNVDEFNLHAKKDFDSIMGFIYLHYITKRNDSKFWREFRDKNPIPESLNKTLKLLKGNDLKWLNVTNEVIWQAENYTQIAYGLGIYEKEINISGFENLSPSLDEMCIIFNEFESTHSKPHKEVLKELKELYKDR